MTIYVYECSKGHRIETTHPLPGCVVRVHGRPCRGELKRVGPGSRATSGTVSREVGK